MAYLVAHHQPYFFQGRSPQQIVVEADASRESRAENSSSQLHPCNFLLQNTPRGPNGLRGVFI
jgi:hypothetical protein